MTAVSYVVHETPLGPLLLAGSSDGLSRIELPVDGALAEPPAGAIRSSSGFEDARDQIDAYFRGECTDFTLDLAPAGTPFQRTVWAALCMIPYGETVSYGALAARIGRPRASRAVGAANGANPLPIVVPCHRVIGADGSLTGFGGGLPAKRYLLEHERRNRPQKGQLHLF